ncbi:MAG: nucleotidyltransferase domain-containing protein [Tissierellales bacterium]|nr:nucleotidyltransferase domain-containing protein [Tissierellales bacterium]
MITKDQIHSIATTIDSKFPIKDIFLFGSYARGEANFESDLDLCVTTKLGNHRKIDMIRAIRREISNILNIPIDILIYDTDEFQQRAAHQNTLEYKILNQGILLNG